LGRLGTSWDVFPKAAARSGRVWARDPKRSGHELGVLAAWRVVEVAHRRLDVGVAHPLLNPADVGHGDHSRPECVAEIVEAQCA